MSVTNNIYVFYLNDFRFLSSLQALPDYIDERGEAQNPGAAFTGNDPRTPNNVNFEADFLKVIQFDGVDELGSGFFINLTLNVSRNFLQAFFADSIELFIRYLNALSDDSFVSGVFWRVGYHDLTAPKLTCTKSLRATSEEHKSSGNSQTTPTISTSN